MRRFLVVLSMVSALLVAPAGSVLASESDPCLPWPLHNMWHDC